ncbi:hypothetical protein ACU5AX_01450 [Sphingomonas sp. XXL09]|uniref:hypothetical protein n=1 Tax=Sphingomonas sp. XXL09 TaxID=3457787 RepID=UPI00406BB196
MANTLYPKFKQTHAATGIGLVSNTIKAQLVDTSAYTYSDAHQFLSSVPAAARYGNPATLLNKTVSLSGTTAVFDADDSLFTSVPAGSSGTTDKEEAIIIYRDTGDPTTSDLIYYIDTATGLPVTPNGGNIVVSWNASGILSFS